MSYNKSLAEETIAAFEKKAALDNETIIAATIHSDVPFANLPNGPFPYNPVSWQEACRILRKETRFRGALCVAWTQTRVLMPVQHALSGCIQVWCVTVPRDPKYRDFAVLYGRDDPEPKRESEFYDEDNVLAVNARAGKTS